MLTPLIQSTVATVSNPFKFRWHIEKAIGMLWNNVIAINLSASNVKLFVHHFLQSENAKHCIALLCIHSISYWNICKWYERFVCKLYLPNEMRLRHISVNVKWIVIRLEIYLHPLRRIYRLCIDSRIVFSINIWFGNACHTAASCDMC